MKAYITLLSSENYLPGVIILAKSLKKVGAQYPMVCALSVGMPQKIRNQLEAQGIPCVHLNRKIQPKVDSQVFKYWNNTFDKLQIWGLTQYEKLVFVDSDMLVLCNIDDLMDREPFTACAAGNELNDQWIYLNSGLIVIQPDKAVEKAMIDSIPAVIRSLPNASVGDQDVINKYVADWVQRPELHLPESYNMIATHVSVYDNRLGYAWRKSEGRPMRVLHFIGKIKPWMRPGLRDCLHILWHLKDDRRFYEAFLWYRRVMKRLMSADAHFDQPVTDLQEWMRR